MVRSVKNLFASDMQEYMRENNIVAGLPCGDVWFVTPSRMFSKENTRLNRELGIHKINYVRRASKNP
jgi:hypothetical protein